MKRVTSRQNAIVGLFRSIARGEPGELLLLDGVHLVSEAIEAGNRVRQVAIAAEAVDRPELRAIIERCTRDRIDIVAATSTVMAALSPVRSPSAIVAIAERPSHDEAELYARPAPLVLVASDVQDPGNVGAIVRVA